VRALILYHYLPFDVSIFGQFKDPLFWILTGASLVPSFGIRVVFFAMILIMIVAGCPADEYQVVQYILGFKGTQFLSSGVSMAFLAAIKYYLCVKPHGVHTCDDKGPGANQDMATSLVDFLGSCILTWVAFFLLPCSNRTAGMREIGDIEEEKGDAKFCCANQYDTRRGGRLAKLMGYDFVCFLLSCGLLYVLVYIDSTEETDKEPSKWEFRTAMFFARVLYALLAFPFMIFIVPVLKSILTHTTPTGYNRQGLCVPCMLHPMPKPVD